MALWLKQSTAATVKLGPFVNSTDGVTVEDGLTISQADVRLSKNGGNIAQKNEASAATHDELGYYDVDLDATDTGTLGRLKVMVSESGALPVWQDFMVLPANTYDSLVSGSDYLQTDATQAEGADFTDTVQSSAAAALTAYDPPTNAEMEARTIPTADYFDPDNDAVANVTLVGTTTTNTDMRGTDSAATAAKLLAYIQLLARSDAAIETDNATELTEINANGGSGAGDYSAQTEAQEALRDWIGDGTNLTEAGGDGDHLTEAGGDGDHLTNIDLPDQTMNITGNITGNLSGSVGSVTGAVGSVTGNVGGNVVGSVASVTGDINTAAGTITNLDALDTAQDAEHGTTQAAIAALNDPTAGAIADAVWDETLADHLGAGSTGNALNAAGAAGDPWSTAIPGAYGAGTAGKIVGDNLNATVSSRSSHTANNVRDAILADSTPFNGADIAAILTDTGTTLPGTLTTILADTNELQTDWTNGGRLDLLIDAILEDTGTTIPALIAALENISAAQVNAEVLDVLNVDTFSELASVPNAAATITQILRWLYALSRNKMTQTATTTTLRNDADDGTIATSSSLSDDGTTFTRPEWS
jgi:hypothetical protein